MLTTIECTECHKRYTIDGKFAGKRVKCKNCGNRIPIPATHVPATPDDPLAHWDEEDDEDLGPPPTFELPADALPPEPPQAQSAPEKPAYLEALEAMRLPPGEQAKPARPPLRERLDAWLPWRARRLFIAGFVAAALVPWLWVLLHRLPWRGALRMSVVDLLALAMFWWVALRLALLGTRLAARLTKFDPPPDLLRRLTAALLIPAILGVAAWQPLTHLHYEGYAYKVVKGRLTQVPTLTWLPAPLMDMAAYTQAQRIIAEAALAACVIAAFFALRFFLRLKWGKSLLAFPVVLVFGVIGLGAVVAANWGMLKLWDHFLPVSGH